MRPFFIVESDEVAYLFGGLTLIGKMLSRIYKFLFHNTVDAFRYPIVRWIRVLRHTDYDAVFPQFRYI